MLIPLRSPIVTKSMYKNVPISLTLQYFLNTIQFVYLERFLDSL